MSSQGEDDTSMQTSEKEHVEASGRLMPGYSYEVREGFSLHKHQRSDIPDIPEIPTSLMVPPSLVSSNTTSTVKTGGRQMTINISQETGTAFKHKEGKQDVGEIHQNLDSIHSHVAREADVLQDLQSQLSVKAHEMERLRAEISQYEKSEREALPRGQLSAGYGAAVTQTGHPRSGLARTVAVSTIGSGTRDTNSIIREYQSKIDDLNIKLKMTTELCAKQDSYYRGVIKELEDRLAETVNGRDHILTLRDKEATNQLNLMRQLESALRKQQQDSSEKEGVIMSLEEKLKYLESCHSQILSILDKLKYMVNEEEVRRGRPEIFHSQDGQNKEITSFAAEKIVQTLQKCLVEDSSEKQSLSTQLEKITRDHEESEKELKAINEQMEQEHETKLEALKKDHAQALDTAESRFVEMKKELQELRQKMDSSEKQHETEVSRLVDETKVLRLELTKLEKEKGDAVNECEKKIIDFQNINNDVKVELKVLREEKYKLLQNLSQEQASNIALKEKLEIAHAGTRAEKDKFVQKSEENNIKEAELKEELQQMRTELEDYKTLLIQKDKEYQEQTKKSIENAAKEEQEKANDRLNIILFELNKVSTEVEQRKTQLENKNTELKKALEEINKMTNDLEKREQELALTRQEKLGLAAKYEQQVKETEILQEHLENKIRYSDKMSQELNNAHILMEKLKAQLEERERTIVSFREQGTNLAEILERNNVAGDSLQREREELVKKVQEQAVEVQEMKKHRELLAKKLKAKDKRVKELEEEKENLQKTVNLKNEELAAWTEERENVLSELKAKQVEVVKLREERDSMNNLIQGKDGEKEKEISKLISRLKGSEQDLSLTKKLLKSKGEMSGKAVRVAETMQREVTEKRGEMDALLNKIHWLQENLKAAVQDKMYYESKSSRLSEDLNEVVLDRDKLRFDVQQTREESSNYQKQVSHLEQALEKAAIKFAESQSVIERLEQELARLKLKHSLELKEQERNLKAGSTLLKVDAATISEILARVNAGLRLPIVSSQIAPANNTLPQRIPVMAQPITLQNLTNKSPQPQTQETPLKDNEVQQDLKCLLQDVRTLISSFQAHLTQSSIAPTPLKQIALTKAVNERASTKTDPEEYKRIRFAKRRIPKGHRVNQIPDTEQQIDRFLDHESQLDASSYMDQEYLENMRSPLRSSSPKPESPVSMATDGDSYPPDPPIRGHGSGNNLDDSDVTSLLSFTTILSGAAVDDLISTETNSMTSEIAPSVRSGQRYSSSTHSKKADKENIGTWRTGSRTSYKKTTKRKDASPPSYERAEMMLRSLAQTGTHLTKKNKEIARLLSEQDRRIKKCRDNEQGIQTLLT